MSRRVFYAWRGREAWFVECSVVAWCAGLGWADTPVHMTACAVLCCAGIVSLFEQLVYQINCSKAFSTIITVLGSTMDTGGQRSSRFCVLGLACMVRV